MSEERNNVEVIPEFKMYITDLETNKDSKEINVSDLIFNDYIEFEFGDYENEDYGTLPYKDFKFFINDYSVTFYSPQMKDLQQKVEQQEKEIERLNNIIDTMLEFSFFKEECPLNFGFGDEKEEKAQDVFYEDDYCEENCNDIYKKCWLKYFEKLQKLKEE